MDYHKINDKQLDITRAIKAGSGDDQAFAELYDKYAEQMFRYISFKFGDRTEAEDLLQEVFLRAWKGLDRFGGVDPNFSAWLYRIAANTVNDKFRKVYRRPQTTELRDDLPIASPDQSEAEYEKRDRQEKLQGILSRLPPDYSEVLELRYVQGFSIAETSEIMGRSNVAIRILQHRATSKAREIYKKSKQS